MKETNIIFFGPPGAGKGTQAQKVSSEINLPHIDTGSLIRDAIKKESALGKKAKEFVESGNLVPDELVIDLIGEKLSIIKNGSFKGFILDGFPRTIPQADALKNLMKTMKLHKPTVINVQAPDEILVTRLSARRLCSNKACGTIYNLISKKPMVEGKCDVCKSDLYQRKDDTKEACTQRLKEYYTKTAPLEEYYRKQELLINVDGTKGSAEVYKQIINELEI